MEFVFWSAVFGCLYSYFIYPLVLRITPSRSPRFSNNDTNTKPLVSLIVTCHNEESRIEEKIINSLEIGYPNLEILIASDCSTDNTNNIVSNYSKSNVTLVDVTEHLGKEYAQLQAIKVAKGEIIVFSDVATRIEPEAIDRMVDYYHDEKIGAVSSEDRFISQDGSVVGEGAYVAYEMWLRKQESSKAGLVGLSGSFFSARREVCEEWDTQSPSDFNTALNCAKLGLVSVSSPDVHGYYKDIKNPDKEYERKIRTIIRGLTSLARHTEVLNPMKFGWFTFQVISHKLMRWCVPWFMLLALVSNLFIVGESGVYGLTLLLQALFYVVALLPLKFESLRESSLFKLPFFFVQVNKAIAHATLRYLSGTRMTVWTPSSR